MNKRPARKWGNLFPSSIHLRGNIMRVTNWISKACAVGFVFCCGAGYASDQPGQNSIKQSGVAQTLGARGFVDRNETLFGGFELVSSTVVYALVRGPSLLTLAGIAGYLDLPRVRFFDSARRDIITGLAQPGTDACQTGTDNTSTNKSFVVNYYQNVRGAPVNVRDTCFAFTLAPGAYTFTVTPSIPGLTSSTATSSPSSGQVLFEVTLGPSS